MPVQTAPFVHSVSFVWEPDVYALPDYLERSAEDHFGDGWSHVSAADKARVIEQFGSIEAACSAYAREDAQRVRDFRAGQWWFETCRAVAEVRYELYDGSFRVERLSSGGLYGIESDCGEEYRQEVESEELADLQAHLARFGVVDLRSGSA